MSGKSFVLGVLLTFLWVVTPFRLLALSTTMFFVHPSPPHFSADDNGYWQALELERRLMGMGWQVQYPAQVMGGMAYGATDPDRHLVLVEESLHWSARAAVLAHEAGHTVEPTWVGRVEGDCFAESVATLITDAGYWDHARFMASARWTCLGVILTEFPAIYHAAALLQD